MVKKVVEVEYINNGSREKQTFSTLVQKEKDELKEIIDNKDIITMHTKEATLEQIFIKVTGRGLA